MSLSAGLTPSSSTKYPNPYAYPNTAVPSAPQGYAPAAPRPKQSSVHNVYQQAPGQYHSSSRSSAGYHSEYAPVSLHTSSHHSGHEYSGGRPQATGTVHYSSHPNEYVDPRMTMLNPNAAPATSHRRSRSTSISYPATHAQGQPMFTPPAPVTAPAPAPYFPTSSAASCPPHAGRSGRANGAAAQ
ncbi:hypothetical protein MKEN_01112000 [Mycena kentingensis (nom. inval.)]|nr:hypothetical protein MKEN_01112000 [Mycena kentingensis (nom. inval.)]